MQTRKLVSRRIHADMQNFSYWNVALLRQLTAADAMEVVHCLLLAILSLAKASANIEGYYGPCVSKIGSGKVLQLDCSAVTSADELGGLPMLSFNEILLQRTSLTHLPFQAFGEATGDSYFVTDNALTHIEYGSLGLKNLENTILLAFSNNRLESFPFEYLKLFPNLQELLLHMNYLTAVPAYGSLPGTLKSIDLSYNQISSIGEYAFVGDATHVNLKYINLRFNHLTTLASNTFYHHGKDITLELNHNWLLHIEDNAFGDQAGGDMFLAIIIHDNNLHTLTEGAFRNYLKRSFQEGKSGKISVLGNQFRCDCSLQWLYVDGIKYGDAYRNMVSNLICQENGVQFWDLLPSYFEVCLEMEI